MAVANKTRWSEKWLAGAGSDTQTVSIKILDGADFSEVTVMILQPIKAGNTKFHVPAMIIRNRVNVWDLLDKLDSDRAKAIEAR